MNKTERKIPPSLDGIRSEAELWERYPRLRPVARGSELLPLAALLGLIIVAWYALTLVAGVPKYILPSPHEIVVALANNLRLIASHLVVTLFEAVTGLAIAVVLGIAVSFVIVWSPWLGRAILPLLTFLQTTPKVAIAPLFLFWFGFGYLPKVVIAFLIAFFPIVIATSTGLASTQKELLELVRSLSTRMRHEFLRVRFPAALPYFFSGFKIAVTLSVIGALVGEFVGSDAGLGYLILVANSTLDAPMLFAVIVVTALMGYALFAAVQLLERLVMPWHASAKTTRPIFDERA